MARFDLSRIFTNQINYLKVVFTRFYMVALASLALTGVVVMFIENADYINKDEESFLTKLVMTLSLAIPLFFSLHLLSEKRNFNNVKTIGSIVFLLGLLILYWLSLGPGIIEVENNETTIIRFIALFLASHGLVSISVFQDKLHINGFWHFNKHMLIRTMTGLFYSGVLFLGIAAAFAALDVLFEFSINGKRYAQVFFLLVCFYNTFFVLGGVKFPLSIYQEEKDYPVSLKIFTQYVLIPLMTLYLVILYAYLVKIIVLWSLPKGWVSNLVLCFSIAGILAFLLVYPIRDQKDSKWVKTFSRMFYFALLPLIILLHLSIWTRISAYGITIERYVVMVLTLWLTVTTLYFLISKKDNIILIPFTLSFIFLLSTFGPWGFSGMSEISQLSRLKKALGEMKIWDGNKITPRDTNAVLNDSVAYKVQDITSYLLEHNGPDVMKQFEFTPWNNLSDSLANTSNLYYYNTHLYLSRINIDANKIKWNPYEGRTGTSASSTSYYFNLKEQDHSFNISGFKYMVPINLYETTPTFVNISGKICPIQIENNLVIIKQPDSTIIQFEILDQLKPLLPQCTGGCPPLTNPIEATAKNGGAISIGFKLISHNLSLVDDEKGLRITSLNSYILYN